MSSPGQGGLFDELRHPQDPGPISTPNFDSLAAHIAELDLLGAFTTPDDVEAVRALPRRQAWAIVRKLERYVGGL